MNQCLSQYAIVWEDSDEVTPIYRNEGGGSWWWMSSAGLYYWYPRLNELRAGIADDGGRVIKVKNAGHGLHSE